LHPALDQPPPESKSILQRFSETGDTCHKYDTADGRFQCPSPNPSPMLGGRSGIQRAVTENRDSDQRQKSAAASSYKRAPAPSNDLGPTIAWRHSIMCARQPGGWSTSRPEFRKSALVVGTPSQKTAAVRWSCLQPRSLFAVAAPEVLEIIG
jgi:hypothetical protein